MRLFNPRAWVRFDFILFLTALALTAFGTAMIYSATLPIDGPNLTLSSYAGKQALYGGLGFGALLLIGLINYRLIRSFTYPIYILNLLLLGGVDAVGRTARGAQRWLELGPIAIQPSELAKLAMILFLADFFAKRDGQGHRIHLILISLLLVAIPMGLIYLQPDLATSLVYIVIWLAALYVAGMRWYQFAGMGALLGLAVPFGWHFLQSYQKQRILTFLNPESDPQGTGWNIIQAKISVGSGGWLGKGFANGAQTQLQFLPEQQTDFIFGVIGEELGFLGALGLMTLLVILLWRILHIGKNSSDPYGRYVAVGVASVIFFQSFVNIGMNIGVVPVAGFPLPFISYGRSALLTTLVAIGILQSVAMHHKDERRPP